MNHDGFIIAFPAGSRGRLIANILSSMVNHVDDPIEYTEYGSAHIHHSEKSYIRLLGDPNIVQQGYDNTFNCVPVLLTHNFPDITKWDENSYLKNKKIIVISIDSNDTNEIILNQMIKNILPRIESFVNNKPLDDGEIKLLNSYRRVFSVHGIFFDKQLLSDPKRITNMLRTALNNRYIQASINDSFYNSTLQDNERILNLEYKHLFSKENDKYLTLEKISNWLQTEYNDSIIQSFTQYDNMKYDVFRKYCPWFLQENP